MSRKLKQVISCQSFSPISDVRDGIIVTKDGKFVKLMEFSPINYGLRSNEDKNMITAQYAAAIRSFPSVVQIKVLSNRANVEHYISGMVESVRHEKNEGTRELMRANRHDVRIWHIARRIPSLLSRIPVRGRRGIRTSFTIME